MKNFKNVLFIIMGLFLVTEVAAQHDNEHHKSEKARLDKETELLLDSAAKHMILFIVKGDKNDFDTALERVKYADSLNTVLKTLYTTHKGLGSTIEMEDIQERKEEIKTYMSKTLMQEILNEQKSKTKTEKVKFKGEKYEISKKAKAKYDIFSTYLPRN